MADAARSASLTPWVVGLTLLGAVVLARTPRGKRAASAAPATRASTDSIASRPSTGDGDGKAASAAPSSAAPDSGASDDSERAAYVVAAIGDSLTDPKSFGGRYLDVLRQHCPETRVDNYARGGTMVNQMKKRFRAEVLGEPADPDHPKPKYTHVIIFGGVNDVVSDETAGRTPAKIERDLSWMYRSAREHEMKVVAITIAPWGGFKKWYNENRGHATREVNAWIRERQGDGVDAVVDAYALLSCGEPHKLCKDYLKPMNDGLHFGPKGHEKLGEAMVAAAFGGCR